MFAILFFERVHNMKKSTTLLSLCSLMLILAGCGEAKPSDSSSLPPATENTTEKATEKVTEEKDDNLLSGKFEKTSDGYQSLESGSMMLLPDTMEEGTFKATMSITEKLADNGVIFAYDKESKSYYFYGINLAKKVVLQKVQNGKTIVLKMASLPENAELSLAVFCDRQEGVIDCYLGDEFLFQVEEDIMGGYGLGLKAGGKKTSYSGIGVTEGENTFNQDVFRYDYAHGEYDLEQPSLISTQRTSMATSIDRTFRYGVLEADISFPLNVTSQNGLVFGLSSDKTNYWEGTGISYYFFYITENGRACLGRTENGKWNTVFEKVIRPFDSTHTYRMRAIRGENTISCYVDGILYGTFSDSAPLTGTKFGVRSGDQGVRFSDIRVHEIANPKKDISEELNIGTGSYYALSNQVIASESSSIMTYKGKTKKNGTLKTFLSPHGGEDNGIIFHVTRGNQFRKEGEGTSYYWFGYQANGMVAFKRVENGTVVKSKDKFLPWGSYSYMGYEVKIVMDGNDFYCYFDGRLAVTYHDDNVLPGEEYGFLAGGKNAIMDRIEEEEKIKPDHYETLIFGHSYMDYWYTYQEDLPEYESIYDIGIGASVTSHWNDYTNEVIAYQPKLGIYGIGINDISANVPANTIVNNVTKMLTDIKAAVPEFEVVLWGVSRCPARTAYNSQISQVNQGYENLSAEMEWIHYIDVERLFCNASGNPMSIYFTDGLHPTHEGYLMMVDQMRLILGE